MIANTPWAGFPGWRGKPDIEIKARIDHRSCLSFLEPWQDEPGRQATQQENDTGRQHHKGFVNEA